MAEPTGASRDAVPRWRRALAWGLVAAAGALATLGIWQQYLAWAMLALLAVVLAWALLSGQSRRDDVSPPGPVLPGDLAAHPLAVHPAVPLASDALLAACLSGAQVGMAVSDRHGHVQLLNPAFTTLWDLPADHPPREWAELVSLMQRRAKLPESVEQMVGDPARGSAGRTYTLVLLDNSIREGTITVARDRAGHVTGWLLTAVDTTASVSAAEDLRTANERLLDLGRLKSQLLANVVAANTERLAAQEQLRAANERLEELLLFKTQLLGNVSHELGTPLTPIRLQLHLVSSQRLGPLTPKQEKSIKIIERNLGRMTNLVRDVLEVARLDAGRLRLDREEFNVAESLEDAVESLELQANQMGVTLELQNHGPLVTYADRNRVTQILFNLLTNAIKYSPRDSVVKIAGTHDEHTITVQVTDLGAGMTEAQVNRLFKPFSQVQEGKRQKHGTGLGLYIARGFADEHGGSLAGTSPGPDQGSTFTLTLPVIKPDDVDEGGPTTARPPRPARQPPDRTSPQTGTPPKRPDAP